MQQKLNNALHTPDMYRFSVAPMMDWTDRHCRYFHRLISRQVLLYTEMVTTGAILRGDRHRFLQFDDTEHPVALQLGGSEADKLAACADIAEDYGYDEINLNVGCPSDRVQSGRFGACLMAEPQLVGDCIAKMQSVVDIPVTVKCRIGIDDHDSYAHLERFIATVADAGCRVFIIHARKAILSGLSPKQNREVPPLHYDYVHRIKQQFPELTIMINGGIKTVEQVQAQLNHCDGVMIGREAYHNPYILAQVEAALTPGQIKPISRLDIIMAFMPYVQTQLQKGVKLSNMSRHILGLYHGQPGARRWRQLISERAPKKDADEQVIMQALNFVEQQSHVY